MSSRRLPRATKWLSISILVGLVVGLGLGSLTEPTVGVLTAVAVTHCVFLVHGWIRLWRVRPEAMRADLPTEQMPKIVDEVVVVLTTLGSLVGIVILVLLQGSHDRHVGAGIALVAVFLSWGSLHLMYAARYAGLYYTDSSQTAKESGAGPIDFSSETPPDYRDFLYFSYNLGMTYQVSDTNVKTTAIRAVVLRHCLLSYVFGVAILATTLNLVSNIVL